MGTKPYARYMRCATGMAPDGSAAAPRQAELDCGRHGPAEQGPAEAVPAGPRSQVHPLELPDRPDQPVQADDARPAVAHPGDDHPGVGASGDGDDRGCLRRDR